MKRASTVQLPCHSKFRRAFRNLQACPLGLCPNLELELWRLLQNGALTSLGILMETFRIDEIARRLMENLPPALRATQRDLESNFRAVLRASLAKLDLVTRDEFDVQSRVLERTRARLEALEARVRAMEGGAADEPPVG